MKIDITDFLQIYITEKDETAPCVEVKFKCNCMFRPSVHKPSCVFAVNTLKMYHVNLDLLEKDHLSRTVMCTCNFKPIGICHLCFRV